MFKFKSRLFCGAALPVFAAVVSLLGCRDAKSTRIALDDCRLVITERESFPSELPPKYLDFLDSENPNCILSKDDVPPGNFMYWSLYGGQRSGLNRELKNMLFLIGMNPDHLQPMMTGLSVIDNALIRKLKENERGCLIGREKMALMEIAVGDRIELSSFNYDGIDLELEIVGELPPGRYDQSAFMNMSYLNKAFAAYEKRNGKKHPRAEQYVAMIFLRVPNREVGARVAKQIEDSPLFQQPRVKCEFADDVMNQMIERAQKRDEP